MTTSVRLFALALLLGTAALSAGCSDDGDGPNAPPASKELDSGNVPPDARFVHTFANAGNFPYHCEIHPVMRGNITIAGGGLDSLIVLIVNSTSTEFQAQAVGGVTTVKPGGYVSWQNQSVTHTVTSD